MHSRMRVWSRIHYYLWAAVFLAAACTENPLFQGGTVLPGKSRISGRISLSDSLSAMNAVVWMEGFDIMVRADTTGAFVLTLPVPSQQPGHGLTGAFALYFYMADYRLASREIVVLDGYVQDSKGAVGENGVLRETLRLEKLLDLYTDVEPDKINESYAGTIDCRIFLQAAGEPVSVLTRIDEDRVTAGFVVPVRGTDGVPLPVENVQQMPSLKTIGTDPVEWVFKFEKRPGSLRAGDYEIVPYIAIMQVDIPEALLRRIGENVQDFEPGFLDVPFHRRGGMLLVVSGGEIEE